MQQQNELLVNGFNEVEAKLMLDVYGTAIALLEGYQKENKAENAEIIKSLDGALRVLTYVVQNRKGLVDATPREGLTLLEAFENLANDLRDFAGDM